MQTRFIIIKDQRGLYYKLGSNIYFIYTFSRVTAFLRSFLGQKSNQLFPGQLDGSAHVINETSEFF